MSDTIEDDDELPHVNGGSISDDDIRALLAKEKQSSRALKLQLETERTGRTRAEAQVSNAQTARLDSEEEIVTTRLTAADAAALGLRRAYSEALAEGRFDEAAEVQDQMVELRAKQVADRQYKTWLTNERSRAVEAKPVQEGVNLGDYSAAQRKWIRDNPEFMDDPKIRAKTFAGHQLAVADGIEVDSPEYFEVINETVHRGRRQEAGEDDAASQQPRRRQEPLDMPVTRRTPAATQQRAGAVKLSADEMEAADITNPDLPVQGRKDANGNWLPGRYETYALQRAKLRSQGRG
jgi:hypothetical protein